MDKKVLLIADDEEMNRRIIKRFLKETFEVIEAENGSMAWDTLQTTHVDLMLLDIIMPEMDGLQVLKLLKDNQQFAHIGVLVATSTKEKTERTALSLGADDIVSKPYDPIVIQKRLENILALKEMNEQKALLQTNDIETYLQKKSVEYLKETELIQKNICKYADMICANSENERLIIEITTEIKQEAGKLTDVFISQN